MKTSLACSNAPEKKRRGRPPREKSEVAAPKRPRGRPPKPRDRVAWLMELHAQWKQKRARENRL
jgi:hypothetical protein